MPIDPQTRAEIRDYAQHALREAMNDTRWLEQQFTTVIERWLTIRASWVWEQVADHVIGKVAEVIKTQFWEVAGTMIDEQVQTAAKKYWRRRKRGDDDDED